MVDLKRGSLLLKSKISKLAVARSKTIFNLILVLAVIVMVFL